MLKRQTLQHKILFVILTFTLLACNFNKMFLHPDKVPVGTKKMTIRNAGDSTIIYFSNDTYQPTFMKNGTTPINLRFTIESVIFKSSNGNNLNGWFLKPKNQNPKITLLHIHGNAGFLLSQYQLIIPLLKNGFQIFLFDYSGFGFSEGKATRKNILSDALSALDYIKSRQDVKVTKCIIYGQSIGGHLSAVVAKKRQNDIDGLVIEGAFSSHKDIAAQSAGVFGRIFVREIYSATKSIKDYHKPLIVIHSTEDETIPLYMGEKIFKNANSPKQFYEIKGSHIYGPALYADTISQIIKNMWKTN